MTINTYDLEAEDMFVEVKSTIARDKREITISNHFQLDPPGKALKLVLCQFEESVFNGVSIDGIIFPKRPFNNRRTKDSTLKRMIYGEIKHKKIG